MLRYGALSILSIFLMTACASNPEVVLDNGNELSLQDESQIIVDGRTAIAVGSPNRLTGALLDIGASEASRSEIGRDLLFVASRMFAILYPLLEPPDVTILSPPSSSTYVRIFEQIESGRYPQVPQDQVPFLTLILPPLTILYSELPEVAEQATLALDQAATMNPDSVLPYLLLGILAERNGRFDDAYLLFDTALKIAPSCYPARYGLARVNYIRQDYDAAYLSIGLLKTVFPDNVSFLTLSTRILIALGRYADADRESKSALKLASDGDSLPLLRIQILRIQILEILGTNDAFAKRLLSRVEEDLPNDIDVLRMRTRFLAKEDKLDEALVVLERAMALYPDDDEFESTYGRLLIATGKAEEGKLVIENTLEDDPDSIENLEILLTQAEANEDWGDAGEYIQRILELDASPDYLRKAVRIYSALERYITAMSYATMLTEDPSRTADDLATYADILILLERSERARVVLEEALEVAETGQLRSALYFTLSTVAENDEERYTALQASLYQDTLNFDTLVALSAYHEEQGDLRKARNLLNQAVTLRPEDTGIKDHLAELEEKTSE